MHDLTSDPHAAAAGDADSSSEDPASGPGRHDSPAPAVPAAVAASLLEVEEDDGDAVGNRQEPAKAAAPVAKERKPPQRPRNPRVRAIEEAFKNQTPVEGLVKAANKGGLEIDLAGVRAFCPLSQIELRFCHDPSPHVGQRLRFKVIKFEGSRNIVLSRKAILAEENAAKAEVTRDHLQPGCVMRGRVVSLVDYGAFVDLGGVTGLIHISELSHQRVARPHDVLKVGEEVEVLLLNVEHPEGRKEAKIYLSLKAMSEDPWARAATLKPGDVVHGKVMRLKPFGAFVELWPGVDGLIHCSNLADPPPADPSEAVAQDQEVEATVISVDAENRRIGLSLVGLRPAPPAPGEGRPPRRDRAEGAGLQVGQIVQTKVDKVEQFGVFVRIDSGGRGLIPNAEMGTPPGTDHKKRFPEGTDIRAQVIEIGQKGRVRLSRKAAENADERAAFSGYMQAQRESATLGTLADLLRAKADERKR